MRDYLIIIAGMGLFAIGFTVFILPHEIVMGGMSGFSTLVYFASGQRIPVAVTMYTVNILMLLVWYKTLGREFVMRTVFGTTVLSLMIGLMEGYFTSHPPLVTDTAMSVLMGSAVCGIGIGMYFSRKGSAGGTDIVAAYLEKSRGISLGRTMVYVDVTIVTCSFFLPFDGDMYARIQARVQTILYGWTSILIYSWLANYIYNLDKQTLIFIILSDKWRVIADRVTHESGRGVTTLDATGYWTQTRRELLLVWCRRYNAEQIYSIVNEVDPTAYIIQTDARSVHGNGFDPLRQKVHPHVAHAAKEAAVQSGDGQRVGV